TGYTLELSSFHEPKPPVLHGAPVPDLAAGIFPLRPESPAKINTSLVRQIPFQPQTHANGGMTSTSQKIATYHNSANRQVVTQIQMFIEPDLSQFRQVVGVCSVFSQSTMIGFSLS
ncbi:MAG: hypothetical protein WBK56_08710, partial [Methanoculleus sp.]